MGRLKLPHQTIFSLELEGGKYEMTKEMKERLEKCVQALINSKDEEVVEQIIDELEDTISQCQLF